MNSDARNWMVRNALSNQVYEAIERRILDFEYEPGSKLVIDQLARDLGVSSTPVRDALTRLAGERIVRFEPYVGFQVRPAPTSHEIRMSFEARLVIEPYAAGLGALRGGSGIIDELLSIQAGIDSETYTGSSESFLKFVHANRNFHESLVSAAENEFLTEAWKNLHHDEIIAFSLHDRGVPDMTDIRQEHEAIIKAVESRNSDRVREAVSAHIEHGRDRILAAHSSPDDGEG